MTLSQLTAISPIDGRYRSKVEKLDNYFSEFALIKSRVMVEVEYFIALCELPLPQLKDFEHDKFSALRMIYEEFQLDDAQEIKDIEKETNHDVKAVEYFLKRRFDKLNLTSYKEFIHFGLTSQDINNVAVPYCIKKSQKEVIWPTLLSLVNKLNALAKCNIVTTDILSIPIIFVVISEKIIPTAGAIYAIGVTSAVEKF